MPSRILPLSAILHQNEEDLAEEDPRGLWRRRISNCPHFRDSAGGGVDAESSAFGDVIEYVG